LGKERSLAVAAGALAATVVGYLAYRSVVKREDEATEALKRKLKLQRIKMKTRS